MYLWFVVACCSVFVCYSVFVDWLLKPLKTIVRPLPSGKLSSFVKTTPPGTSRLRCRCFSTSRLTLRGVAYENRFNAVFKIRKQLQEIWAFWIYVSKLQWVLISFIFSAGKCNQRMFVLSTSWREFICILRILQVLHEKILWYVYRHQT